MFLNDKLYTVGYNTLFIDEYGDSWFYRGPSDDGCYHHFKYKPVSNCELCFGVYVKYVNVSTGNFENMTNLVIRYLEE